MLLWYIFEFLNMYALFFPHHKTDVLRHTVWVFWKCFFFLFQWQISKNLFVIFFSREKNKVTILSNSISLSSHQKNEKRQIKNADCRKNTNKKYYEISSANLMKSSELTINKLKKVFFVLNIKMTVFEKKMIFWSFLWNYIHFVILQLNMIISNIWQKISKSISEKLACFVILRAKGLNFRKKLNCKMYYFHNDLTLIPSVF